MFTGPHLFNCSVRGVPARNLAHTKIIVTLNYFSKFPPVMKIEWPILFCPLRHAPSDAKQDKEEQTIGLFTLQKQK